MWVKGLLNYGFEEEAREMASETIVLLGRDIERYGGMHEYYQPSNSEPVLNIGFLNWNMLVINMIAWMEGREMVEEF
jgi:putative isomerase